MWPPVLYGALGIWFLLVGASRGSAIKFIAVIAATTATIIYFTGKRLIGRWAGVLAAVLFVASPLVQEASARVIAEHLVTLGMLVSTLCFARFSRTERISDGLAFGIAAAAAILTHGNAWALGLVPGVTIALTNRWYLLRRPGLWLTAVPVLVFCVPWYVLAPSIIDTRQGSITSFLVPGYIRFIYFGVGLPVLIFALIAAFDRYREDGMQREGGDRQPGQRRPLRRHFRPRLHSNDCVPYADLRCCCYPRRTVIGWAASI